MPRNLSAHRITVHDSPSLRLRAEGELRFLLGTLLWAEPQWKIPLSAVGAVALLLVQLPPVLADLLGNVPTPAIRAPVEHRPTVSRPTGLQS